jgi:predicted transcriptional regulator
MKRGRRSIRDDVISQILDILSNTQTPLTTSSIRMLISNRFDKNLSWNTVRKYLNELVKSNQISSISLPHSKIKDKTGLVLYILKK